MILNPEKCDFEVFVGKLLDFLVSHQGIEDNPKKIRAVENMQPSAHVKNVKSSRDASQRLVGSSLNWVNAPSRFSS
jgi:hypothetical protein